LLRRRAAALLFLAALGLFCFLRLRNIGHLLVWDEAQFVLYTRSLVEGTRDPYWFYWSRFFHLHPPVYLYLCSFLYRVDGGDPRAYEAISFLFSLGTFLVTWRLAVRLYGRRAGAWTAFFLAVATASTFFDTWIKQDAAAVFFSVLCVHLFMQERYLGSGVALGLGMLSKETAVFALLTLLAYSLAARERRRLGGAVKAGLLAAAVSGWWYLFVSDYVRNFARFFAGRGMEAQAWRAPWGYYFSGLPADLGWVPFCLSMLGCLVCLRRYLKRDRKYALPLCWFLPTYLFLSFSTGKPYWMVSSALPALALLAALGAVSLLGWVRRGIRGRRAAAAGAAVLAAALLLGSALGACTTREADYNEGRNPDHWQQAVNSRRDALFLKGAMRPGDRVAAIFNSSDMWDPTFTYYLGDVDLVPASHLFLKDPDAMALEVRKRGIDWIYIGIYVSAEQEFQQYDQDLRYFLARLPLLLEARGFYQTGWSVMIELEEGQGE
jgi:4-amino-4-deoxy-L-arabinose transferase-like glycosyltransferase